MGFGSLKCLVKKCFLRLAPMVASQIRQVVVVTNVSGFAIKNSEKNSEKYFRKKFQKKISDKNFRQKFPKKKFKQNFQ
jgi:hypothetical protein